MTDLTEDQKQKLEELDAVSEIAQEGLDEIEQGLNKLKEQVENPETREAVMVEIIKSATQSLLAVDKQFSNIALSIEALFKGHNDLVSRFNETVNNREWLAAVVDTRLAERERLLIEEHQIGELRDKFSVIAHNDVSELLNTPLEPGQVRAYIRYPSSPETLIEEDIDTFSSNIVLTCDENGILQEVSKKDNVVLFSAASLVLSEYYTEKVQQGELVPKSITTADGKEYLLLDIFVDMEILNSHISEENSGQAV